MGHFPADDALPPHRMIFFNIGGISRNRSRSRLPQSLLATTRWTKNRPNMLLWLNTDTVPLLALARSFRRAYCQLVVSYKSPEQRDCDLMVVHGMNGKDFQGSKAGGSKEAHALFVCGNNRTGATSSDLFTTCARFHAVAVKLSKLRYPLVGARSECIVLRFCEVANDGVSENIAAARIEGSIGALLRRKLAANNSVESLPDASHIAAKNAHRWSSIEAAAIAAGCAAAAVLLFVLVFLCRCTRPAPASRRIVHRVQKKVIMFRQLDFPLTYDMVLRATGGFSVNNLIGNGGFGTTYRAELAPGLVLAVKRLSPGKFQGPQQFEAEVRTLGMVHNPNLVTLIGYHASSSEMFLVYNYLPGGNLESLLHHDKGKEGFLSWKQRYKIALDIAQALAYLHDECVPKVLHRDIKPSNVLLDNNLNAYLSDFGLARLLSASESHATTDVEGTFGYVAPEYAMTCRLSDKADVYSYGVVLLELLSGKKALDPCFSAYGHGFNIVAWAWQLSHKDRSAEILAPGLWEEGPRSELLGVSKLAVSCTMASLSIRPRMRQVVGTLTSLRQPSKTSETRKCISNDPLLHPI